jgi:hypothetical protein
MTDDNMIARVSLAIAEAESCSDWWRDLSPGLRIGNNRLDRRPGSGLTAEAYLATEVMTNARGVVNILENNDPRDPIAKLRNVTHYAWVLEEFAKSGTRLLPFYHHMGHAFLPCHPCQLRNDNSQRCLGPIQRQYGNRLCVTSVPFA